MGGEREDVDSLRLGAEAIDIDQACTPRPRYREAEAIVRCAHHVYDLC